MRMYQLRKLVFIGILLLMLAYSCKLFRQMSFEDWKDPSDYWGEVFSNALRSKNVSRATVRTQLTGGKEERAMETQSDKDKVMLAREIKILANKDVPLEEIMKEIDSLRQERLQMGCDRLSQEGKILDSADLGNLDAQVSVLVSDKYKVMFCFTGDVYSESWKMTLGGESLRSLYSYREESISYRLKFYYKFLMVQQPLFRLLSTYKSWVLPNEKRANSAEKHVYQEVQKIAEAISKKREGQEINSTMPATFSDFASFVIKHAQSSETLHPLWERLNVLCQPCALNYDFISRAETEPADSKYLISHLKIKLEGQHETAHTTSSDAENLEEIRKALGQDIAEQIYKAYSIDHDLFGYPKPWD